MLSWDWWDEILLSAAVEVALRRSENNLTGTTAKQEVYIQRNHERASSPQFEKTKYNIFDSTFTKTQALLLAQAISFCVVKQPATNMYKYQGCQTYFYNIKHTLGPIWLAMLQYFTEANCYSKCVHYCCYCLQTNLILELSKLGTFLLNLATFLSKATNDESIFEGFSGILETYK